MFGGGKAESAKDERTPLVRSGSQGPKPMYLAPRTNSISKVNVEQVVAGGASGGTYQNGDSHQGGILSSFWPFGNGGGARAVQQQGAFHKMRKAPVKVEPKVFFANERTFLAWLNMSVTLASISVAILAFADHNEFSQIYGFIILPVAIAFVIYALRTFVRRSAMLRARMPGPYEDRVGPVVLTILLVLSILVNMVLKFIDIFSAKRAGEVPVVAPSIKGFKPGPSTAVHGTGPL